MSDREQMANRIASWMDDYDGWFSNILQSFQGRDDGKPGGGYSITFRVHDVNCQLVVWNEKRLDFHMDINAPEVWTRFNSEEEFYSFARTAWNIQGPPRPV